MIRINPTFAEYKNYLPKIRAMAGYREKNILNNLDKIELVQDDKNYKVYRFTDTSGNSFDYEATSNHITG